MFDPSYAKAHFNLASLLHEKRDVKEAERAYRAAIKADPGDAKAHYNLSLLRNDQGDMDGVEVALRAALRADPGYVDASVLLATILEKKAGQLESSGNFAAAIELYEECVKLWAVKDGENSERVDLAQAHANRLRGL